MDSRWKYQDMYSLFVIPITEFNVIKNKKVKYLSDNNGYLEIFLVNWDTSTRTAGKKTIHILKKVSFNKVKGL